MKKLLSVLFLFVFVFSISIKGYCAEGDISLSGFLSADYSYSHIDRDPSIGTDEDSSDVFVYDFGLAVSAGLAENVKGDVLFLYEEGDGDDDIYAIVDEAYLTYQKGSVYGKFGKLYIPFANAGTSFLVDPYTLSIGEMRESAIIIGVDVSMLNIELGGSNGDSDKFNDNNNNVDDYFAALTLIPVENEKMTVAFKAGYITDITDTEVLYGDTFEAAGGYTDRTGAYCASLSATAKTGSLLVEYVTAEDDMDKDLAGAKPEALNIEIAATVTDEITLALKYEDTDEFTTIVTGGDSDIKRYGAIASYSLNEKTTLKLEYLNDEDDNGNTIDTLTAHIGLEF